MQNIIGFKQLEQSLIDVIKESQIKLGYDNRALQLYYPLGSLNHMFGTELSEVEMLDYMKQFVDYVEGRLGHIVFSSKKERFCIVVPPEGITYVHENVETTEFLKELVLKTASCGNTLDMIIAIFRKYSDKVVVKDMDNGEFDCLVYFEDGKPDDYLYCLHKEGAKVIYHRYQKEDYEEFGF